MAENIARTRESEISRLLRDKLGARGNDLPARLKQARRQMPFKVQPEAAVMADALEKRAHPKLMKQVDLPRLQTAERRLLDHLKAIDTSDRRKGAILGALAGLSFNLFVLTGLITGILLWRGLL
ncbi:hypothetical protein TQ29_04285 [Actibacterium sp. EMB200-NS6]|nr:hypothetical protein TQ29_04285 [Actibacterium sp. EMB200-NS6]